ncbi:MAG: transcriptional regulator [Firmicutes bacterium HGW-Firmicutes-17]|jgi:transcriptional regulator with XRE-family HTH domain|nr:MAG: transcriptional regulator [Firmicutes bacterium HGW-Firmicutes-17]
MDKTIGSKIKFLRARAGLNQKELAEKLNIAKSTMSQYESNQRVPSDDLKVEIAKIFNVSTDYLLGVTDDPIPVRDVNQDLYDEHNYTDELEAFLNDSEMASHFHNYDQWSDEEKRNLLNILKGQEALREKNQKK